MKIILAVPDEDLQHTLCHFLEKRIPKDTLVILRQQEHLVQRIRVLRPKLVVMDLTMPGQNGLSTLREIQELPYQYRPELIVLSSFLGDWMQADLAKLRPMYFAPMPCDGQLLAEQILHCCRERIYLELESCSDLEQAIRAAVHSLGIAVRCKGCVYIREGIRRIYEDDELRYGLTKRLYPGIAKKYQTTAMGVERAIRSAIDVAWKRDGILWRDMLFDRRPSCGELLVFMAEYLTDILGEHG